MPDAPSDKHKELAAAIEKALKNNPESLTKSLVASAAERDPKAFKASEQKSGQKPPRFEDDKPSIAMFVRRSKNANLVCYDVSLSERRDHLYNLTAEAYWLELEPSYKEANQKKGHKGNRTELSMIERKLAYGFHVGQGIPIAAAQPPPAKAAAVLCSDVYPFSFTAMSTRAVVGAAFSVPVGSITVLLPFLFVTVNDKLGVMSGLYVKIIEPKHFYQLPSVDYLDLTGFLVNENGKIEKEQIKK